jgi:hypothetical protein
MDFQKVLPSDESIVMFAKIAVNQGRSPGIEKHDFYDAIVNRAEALRADGESRQQAFAKVITEDKTGRLLYKAMQIAPGAEVKPAPQPAPPSREELARLLGPAHARLHSMAVDHQRAHSGMSYQQSYSYLYTRPENEPLREKIKAEHMAATLRTLSIGEAQNLDPARAFPPYGHPGDRGAASAIGRVGRRPAGSVDG